MKQVDDELAVFADWNDALTGVVHALGGWKKVAVILRPEYADRADVAGQWLRDCLNREKREKLSPEQVFLLLRSARDAGYHAAKYWQDDELGYERGKPVSAETEAIRLQREFIDAVRTAKLIGEKLEKLTVTPLQAVSGGKA